MSSSPLILALDTPLFEAAAAMRERKCDYGVVLEGPHPVGVVTERDIAHWCAKKEIGETMVNELLHHDCHLIHKEIPLQEAATLMEAHGIHQLIVVDETGNLVGLLSRHDVLHAVHGAYFEYLIRVIDHKNDTISKIGEQKKELKIEKESIEKNALKLRKLFEALPDGVVLLESSTMRAVEFNEAAYQQLGYDSEEFALLGIPDYCTTETPEETRQHIEAIEREGKDSFVTQHRTKDGSVIDVWVNVIAIDLGGVPHMIAVFRDITEQKRIERHLQEQQAELAHQSTFLRTLLDNIPDLIFSKDLDGKYLACNTMFERFFGEKESAIIGKTDFDFVDAALAQFFRDNDHAAIRGGKQRNNEEYLMFADKSYEGQFEVTKVPMKDASRNVIGMLGIARDITERKRYEARLETLANYDPLTGLANRALLMSHLQNSIVQAKRHTAQIALLMFDLDRFKDALRETTPIEPGEVPEVVIKAFRGAKGEGEFAYIQPKREMSLDDGRNAMRFLEDVGEIKTPTKTFYTVSDPLIFAKVLKTMMQDAPKAIGLAILIILVLLWLDQRRLKKVWVMVLPILLGEIWLLGFLFLFFFLHFLCLSRNSALCS